MAALEQAIQDIDRPQLVVMRPTFLQIPAVRHEESRTIGQGRLSPKTTLMTGRYPPWRSQSGSRASSESFTRFRIGDR